MKRTCGCFSQFFLLFGCTLIIVGVVITTSCERTNEISAVRRRILVHGQMPVTVQGSVGELYSVPLVNVGAYRLIDDTGNIWILSIGNLPFQGSETRIHGVAYSTIASKALPEELVAVVSVLGVDSIIYQEWRDQPLDFIGIRNAHCEIVKPLQ